MVALGHAQQPGIASVIAQGGVEFVGLRSERRQVMLRREDQKGGMPR